MQSIESECIWYTGFTDWFLCFELLENSHYPDIKESHTLVLNELNFFRRLTDEYIFSESIVRYCLNWLLDRIEMVQIGKEEEEYEMYNQDINPRCIDEDLNSLVELFEVYLKDKNYYIRLHTNEEKIRHHLDLCLIAWREWKFFNNKRTSRNIFTSEKQESIILNKLISFQEKWYDMKNHILYLWEILKDYNLDKWISEQQRDEPEIPLNPFLCLWSLQEKWYLKIHFGSTNLMVLDDPIYRIEVVGKSNWKSEILSQESENKNTFLESSNIENANEIKVSFDFNDKKLLHITPYIVYDKAIQEFTNPKNLKKYKLTQIYSRHLIDLLTIKNNYPVIEFIEKNPSLYSEYKKWKKWWKKWSSMHEFLQSKTKNIKDKLELHLAISKEESTSFFSCSKDLIAINTID